MNTEERTAMLERVVRDNPERFIGARDEDGVLRHVVDRDTGRLWLRIARESQAGTGLLASTEGGWVWID